MGLSILEGPKAGRIADALEIIAVNGAGQAIDKIGWAGAKNIVRGGLAERAYSIGNQLPVEHVNSMSAGVGTSTGITAATVNEDVFLAAESIIGSGIHVFKYADGIWSYEGESVSLATYGITITGTPANGDEIIITEAFDKIDLDVVSFAPVIKQGAATESPAMWLQSHWALQTVQFDASEAIWACVNAALPAGTYHFTIGTTWGANCVAGTSYQFTLEHEVPIGGQIVIGNRTSFYTWGAPEVAAADWKVYTFESAYSITPIDGPVGLTVGSTGTDLGSLNSTTKYSDAGDQLNNLQRCAYGYNRWSQSAIRQWLNSALGVGKWWKPQNIYDRPPQQLATLRGFLAGLPSDFLSSIQRVKVMTALNTVTDSEIGASEDTYDLFFLPSLEQEYIMPQAAGVEGSYWPYWKERLELSSPQATGTAGINAAHIRYAVENHNSAQTVRLRSALRGYAFSAWDVTAAGSASSTSATIAYRLCPACVIC